MIKFRAWDKETNKYFKPTYQAYVGRLEELTITLSGRLQKRTCRGMVDESMFPGRYVVEQFTGLKDVNGKDIYEGDILENRKYRSIVKFASGKFLADLIETIQTFDLIGETHGSKVIGNVHENLELLKG
ncbi:YopX family protein [Lactiplantibacillus plantarum]|uniref:YopX family protein n=1 Tax=Lactiplantibacillus plantarum TaxID=1590 RepID=UPI0030F2D818